MRVLALLLAGVVMTFGSTTIAVAFDHQYQRWDRLLKQHVVWIDQGYASQVDYTGFGRDRAELQLVLNTLSGVSRQTYQQWAELQRLAFLINAYNAFTIELVLTGYPALQSIKELGSLFRSAWQQKFFTLLDEKRHLDAIEHDMIRKEFSEPRIHFAVVCASIGCPALRDEAYTADKLEMQLEDSTRRFLADKSRNRYNSVQEKLEISSIFKWYGEDFHPRYGSVKGFFARYAELLAPDDAGREQVSRQRAGFTYLAYDWALNDINQAID